MSKLIPKWKTKFWPWNLQFKFGGPGQKSRLLHTFIYDLDPEILFYEFGFEMGSSLKTLNKVIELTDYQREKEEHWIQTPEGIYEFFRQGLDDCDAMASAVASVEQTFGNVNIRLAAGVYGIGDDVFPNHAYAIEIDPEQPNNPWVLEGTRKNKVGTLPRLKKNPMYKTKFVCNAKGDYWQCVLSK